jgi:hypothetical protein
VNGCATASAKPQRSIQTEKGGSPCGTTSWGETATRCKNLYKARKYLQERAAGSELMGNPTQARPWCDPDFDPQGARVDGVPLAASMGPWHLGKEAFTKCRLIARMRQGTCVLLMCYYCAANVLLICR